MAQRNVTHGRPRGRTSRDRTWSPVQYELAQRKKEARARARREKQRPGQMEIGDLIGEA